MTLISHYDPLLLGNDTTINYAETSWLFKNAYDNYTSLRVTIKDTSFAKASNILGFQGLIVMGIVVIWIQVLWLNTKIPILQLKIF